MWVGKGNFEHICKRWHSHWLGHPHTPDVHPASSITPKDRRIMGVEAQACANEVWDSTPCKASCWWHLGSRTGGTDGAHSYNPGNRAAEKAFFLPPGGEGSSLQFPPPSQNRATSMINSLGNLCGPTVGPQTSPHPLGCCCSFLHPHMAPGRDMNTIIIPHLEAASNTNLR